ncbi:MAG: hypothetical protein LQ344_005542 [Seirophora lacunosa]|nr:MAG: hypothetical protein LQ344_005542 [Seirophora lacunosa]
MLPSARSYMHQGGLSPQAAAYAVIGCFLGGVIGIQFVSRVLHHYIPSDVVDCDHSHDEPSDDCPDQQGSSHESRAKKQFDEQSPLLAKHKQQVNPTGLQRSVSASGALAHQSAALGQRPSMHTRVSKLESGVKSGCRGDGRCFGYSDPCAQECLKAMARNPTQMRNSSQTNSASQPNLLRSTTVPLSHAVKAPLEGLDEEDHVTSTDSSTTLGPTHHQDRLHHHRNQAKSLPPPLDPESNGKRTSFSTSSMDDTQQRHHHHVPTNAFLSIGLQTSIAIALHKLPEGFITFATNHANPKLGFAVFMALFIHNITEGFAMALPLYLAIGSRLKSMFWSSLLGGASQPLGAGMAALWFKMARTSDKAPGETLYGCMFALTGGIMAAVALQLFAESLALNHNRNLCMTFAFVGMGILGTSFALTAG